MIKSLSNDGLIAKTHSLFKEERRLDLDVLRHLYEIESRRLYLERGFPSLFEMCVVEFKLSRASAHRRISAMRLLKEVPDMASKIETGELNVSVIAQAQSFFRLEKQEDRTYSKEEKRELLKSFENKSTREVEKTLASLNPEVLHQESVKPISATQSKLTLVITNELKAKMDELKDLKSHANPSMSYEGLLELLVDQDLKRERKKIEPQPPRPRKSAVKQKKNSVPAPEPKAEKSPISTRDSISMPELSDTLDSALARDKASASSSVPARGTASTRNTASAPNPVPAPEPSSIPIPPTPSRELTATSDQSSSISRKPTPAPRERAPSAELKRKIWHRDRAQCTHQDPATGRQCQARAFLQADHIVPYSEGGLTTEDNLRILCAAHNRGRSHSRKKQGQESTSSG